MGKLVGRRENAIIHAREIGRQRGYNAYTHPPTTQEFCVLVLVRAWSYFHNTILLLFYHSFILIPLLIVIGRAVFPLQRPI